MTSNTYRPNNEKAAASQRPFLIVTWVVSTLTSFLGLRVIMPGEGLWRDFYAVIIAVGGVFCCLYVLWHNQKHIFIELEPVGRSPLALASHLASVLLIILLSTPSSFIAMSWEDASERDMQFAQKIAEEYGVNASRSYHASASIAHFIDAKADEMDSMAESARNGGLTGVPGEGAIYLRYRQLANQLRGTSSLISNTSNEAERVVQQLDVQLGRMRNALDSDITLNEKVTAFEAAYRDYSQLYVKLTEIGLARLVETDLSNLEHSMIAVGTNVALARKAMKLVNGQISKLSGDITEYIQTKSIPIKPLPAYKLDSPAIVSFKYAFDYWVQLGLALSMDLTSLLSIWLLMAAKHEERNFGDTGKLYSTKDIELLANTLSRVSDKNALDTQGGQK